MYQMQLYYFYAQTHDTRNTVFLPVVPLDGPILALCVNIMKSIESGWKTHTKIVANRT